MFKVLIFSTYLFFYNFSTVFAQIYSKNTKHQDCIESALLSKDTSFFQIHNNPSSQEEFSSKIYSKLYFNQVHNLLWTYFYVSDSRILNFEILPKNINADVDFVLFPMVSTLEKTCELINQKKLEPLRINLSRNDLNLSSITGINDKGKDFFVGEGVGNPFSSPVYIDDSAAYILVIDDVYGNSDSVMLTVNCEKTKKNVFENDSNFIYGNEGNILQKDSLKILNLNIFSESFQEPLNANVFIYMLHLNSKIPIDSFFSITNLYYPLNSQKTYFLKVLCNGYLPVYRIVKPSNLEMFRPSLDIFMPKIKYNNIIDDKNLLFKPNSFDLIPESYITLDELCVYFQLYPLIKINISGNVNFPKDLYRSNSELRKNYKLSKQRAIIVRNYFINKGIPKSRISVSANSNTKMLFPDPKNQYEKELNRRVEIRMQ